MEAIIETERLILREILPQDENGLFELDSDPEVHRYLGNQTINNIEQSRDIIKSVRQQYIENGIGRWAMIEKKTNCFVGWTGLKLVRELINNHQDYYDLGYRLLKKYWGQGYATESAKASLDYGFTQLNLSDIYAAAEVGNLASRNVLEKLGLKHIETYDRMEIQTYWFHISQKDWLNI